MTAPAITPALLTRVTELLQLFRLPTVADQVVARLTMAGHRDALPALLEILELEASHRQERKVARLRAAAKLPPGKTFATLHEARLPRALLHTLRDLASGAFLEHSTNVLCFGLPGVGKSHAAAAIGHALVEAGHAVYFVAAYELVQHLLKAKQALELPRTLRQLDRFELLILDDIGYVQQSADEAEVLFTLMAERYERGSLLLTSNLVFSQWEQIFKNPMTTAAAIDRLVHHAVILEFDVSSFRTEQAQKRAGRSPKLHDATATAACEEMP
jgi:DNA replication protein DnaC